jgi:DNA modification methylase
VGLFPQTNSGGFCGTTQQPTNGQSKGKERQRTREDRLPDSGSAARFFYCAKASKADRGDANHHPTVKPTDLMRYLCRLVTPPNGTILDPFMGSGSTGKAAIMEGFRFIGIEREAEYLEIARARIDHVTKEPNLWQS